MKKFIILVFIIIFADSTAAFSSETSKYYNSEFGFNIGLNEYQVKEDILNKIRHRGLLLSSGLFHEKTTDISLRKIDFNFIINTLKSRYDPDNASIVINPSLTYRYARKVKDIDRNTCFFLGGIIGTDTHITYFENWDESHFYWLTSYFLGLDGVVTYQRSDRSYFQFEFNSPVIALISRPPERFLYKEVNPEFSWIVGKMHDNITLTSIHRHFVLNMNAGYTLQYSNRFKQRIEWRFSYIKNRMKKSKDINVLYHTLGISFIF